MIFAAAVGGVVAVKVGIGSLISSGITAIGQQIINNALQIADKEKVTHIMQSKHAWDLVGATDWNAVKNVINNAMANGSAHLSEQAGKIIFSLSYNGQIIEVQTKIVDGVLKIVDAWVKTG